jgi:hypothetical protein
MENENKQTVEQPHSTKIAVNAKGQWSGEIKVYASTPEESYRIALKQAEALEQMIKMKNA